MSATTTTDDRGTEHQPVEIGDYIDPSDFSDRYADEESRWTGLEVDSDSFGHRTATIAWDGQQIAALWRHAPSDQYQVKAVAEYDFPDVDVEHDETSTDGYNQRWGTEFEIHEAEEQTDLIVLNAIYNPPISPIRFEDISWIDGAIQLKLFDQGAGVDFRATIS